jgi:hypothetical protein
MRHYRYVRSWIPPPMNMRTVSLTGERPLRPIIPLLVLHVDGPRAGDQLLDLADEVSDLSPGEVIVAVPDLPDDQLGKIAMFMGLVSTESAVKVCGLKAGQVRVLFGLGVDPGDILVGRWSPP